MAYNSLKRAELEHAENWEHIDIPELVFPTGWRVKPMPPFNGALARFIITNTHDVRVSVYFDPHGALGACQSPYWETYPHSGDLTIADDDDTNRWFGSETTEMLEFIGNLGCPVRGAIAGLTGEGLDDA